MTPDAFIDRLKSRIKRVGYEYVTCNMLNTDALYNAVIDSDDTVNDMDRLVERLISESEQEIIESKRAAMAEQSDKEKTEMILNSKICPSLRGNKI